MDPKFYLVGGAVRDHLLNRESKDRDYVVVGATPEWMLNHGFDQVGASFPVYLKGGCEYALARQERKVGPGYHGFETTYDTGVTLEADLARRDLTINSMAMTDNGQIIDPYGGQHDLAQGILRHTSEAFAEDPLRILRLARFAARYGFKVANDTVKLARQLVEAGELEHLPKERIWMELWKGFQEPNPGIMVDVLEQVGALDRAPLNYYISKHSRMWLTEEIEEFRDQLADSPELKFLMVMGNIAERVDLKKANELRIPKTLYRAAQLYCELGRVWARSLDEAEMLFEVLEKTNFVNSEGTPEMVAAIKVLNLEDQTSLVETVWEHNLSLLRASAQAIRELDMRAITADRSDVKEKVRAAKFEAVRTVIGD